MSTAIPNVTITVSNEPLNPVTDSPANTVVVFGCSSGGTENIVSGPYYRNDVLVSEYGWGPGIEMVANLVASNVPTYFVKVETDTPGAASAVTHDGTGTSVLTLTGDPFDAYDVIVLPVVAGTAGSNPEPKFTISLDGGRTVSDPITMPANHVYSGLASSTGLTFNFTAATLVVGDSYTFTTTAPVWSAADVSTAILAFRESRHQAALGYVVGAASKTQADTITNAINTFDDEHRYVRFLLETVNIDTATQTEAQWMTAVSNDYATYESDRVGVAAGYAVVPSAITQIEYWRCVGQLAIVRAGLVSVGTSIARVKDGALLPNLNSQPVDEVNHDERQSPGWSINRFITVRSFVGKVGYYITQSWLMHSPQSPYKFLQYGRVVDEVCRVSDSFFTEELNDGVRVGANGFILPVIARQLESGNDAGCRAAVVNSGDASLVRTIVSRTDNIIATSELNVSVEIVPLGYIADVAITVGLKNPANAVAA